MQVDDNSSITTTSSSETGCDNDTQNTHQNENNKKLVKKRSYTRLMRQYRFLNNSNLKNDSSCFEINDNAVSTSEPTAATSRETTASIIQANINLFKNLVNRKLLPHSPFSSTKHHKPSKNKSQNTKKIKKNSSTARKTIKSNVFSLLQSILNNKRNSSQKNLLKSTVEDNNKAFMNEEEAANYFINNLNLIKTNINYNKLFEFKNLQYLTIMNMKSSLSRYQLNEILLNLNEKLKYLNLTNTCSEPVFADIQDRIKFKYSLNYLYFCNYNQNLNDFYANLNFICMFKNLVFLDVSNYSNPQTVNIYKNASFTLGKICFLLANLTYLDISGTNLGNCPVFKIFF
jgi:hypothetical protein